MQARKKTGRWLVLLTLVALGVATVFWQGGSSRPLPVFRAGPTAVEEGGDVGSGPGLTVGGMRPPAPTAMPMLRSQRPPLRLSSVRMSQLSGQASEKSSAPAAMPRSAGAGTSRTDAPTASAPGTRSPQDAEVSLADPPLSPGASPGDAGAPGPARPDLPPKDPVLQPPVLLSSVRPQYPAAGYQIALSPGSLTPQLRLEAAQGRVVLKVLVRSDGTVGRVEVAASSGSPVLDQTAVTAATAWRFAPATRDGQPIDAWVLIPVRFIIP